MRKHARGFTLVELSIVLVIIGLIIGAIILGKEMIEAAGIRAQIAQIEKYKTAVNTFQVKYGYLPGDIPDPTASAFGFIARGPHPGEGDGDGILEGVAANTTPGNNYGIAQANGETAVFWMDLSKAGLIDGSFTGGSAGVSSLYTGGCCTSAELAGVFPTAKLGQGNYVYVYSGGYGAAGSWNSNGLNYFGLSAIQTVVSWSLGSLPGLTVSEAYNIDSKIDDGYPQSGTVTAAYVDYNFTVSWAAGGGAQGTNSGAPSHGPSTAATSGSSTTCYDNGGVAGAQQHYSTEQKNGVGVNCAISFQF